MIVDATIGQSPVASYYFRDIICLPYSVRQRRPKTGSSLLQTKTFELFAENTCYPAFRPRLPRIHVTMVRKVYRWNNSLLLRPNPIW